MPRLVRMYIRNVLIGFGLSMAFTGLLLGLNVVNLWHLVTHSGGAGIIAVVMLVVFNTIVFAGVQFAIAIMRMAEPEDGGKGGRRQPAIRPEPVAQPVAATVRAHNHR